MGQDDRNDSPKIVTEDSRSENPPVLAMPKPRPMVPPTLDEIVDKERNNKTVFVNEINDEPEIMISDKLIVPSPVSVTSVDSNGSVGAGRIFSSSELRRSNTNISRPARFNRESRFDGKGKGGKGGKGDHRSSRTREFTNSRDTNGTRKVIMSPMRHYDLTNREYNGHSLDSPLWDRLEKRRSKISPTSVLSIQNQLRYVQDVIGQRRVGLKPSAAHPLITRNGVVFSTLKGKFVNNNIDMLYGDVLGSVIEGELGPDMLPLRPHVFNRGYAPAESLLRHSVMNMAVATTDSRPNDVKKAALEKFSNCTTVSEAFDRVIANVDFRSLTNGGNYDFSTFLDATNGDYIWFITMLVELLAELPLTRSTMMCPIFPMLDTYSGDRKLGNCFTLDDTATSYVARLMEKMKNIDLKRKLMKRMEFTDFVYNCSRQGLARCITDGTGVLSIMTINDKDLCVSTILDDAFSNADANHAYISKLIWDVMDEVDPS
jgi:hypothetical protein